MSHGVLDCCGHCASYFGFANIPDKIENRHIHLMTILVPHLHSAYSKISTVKKELSLVTSKQLKIKHPENNRDSPLTSRETEILQWVFTGKTNREISDTLHISQCTVKNHVQQIIQKLDANNRQHAAAKALQLGIIKIE